MIQKSNNITVIIPVLGQYAYTAQCLVSLQLKSSLVDEIIVIDNEENSSTAKSIIQVHEMASVYNPRRNLGVSKSWDLGIKMAKNNLVAVINNDIDIITQDWDKKLLEQWGQYPDAAIFCPWPVGDKNEVHENTNPPHPGLNGSFFVIDKERLQLTDNYKLNQEYVDTNYTPAYWEDCDLLVQVRQAGFESYVSPQVYIVHYGNKTAGPLLPSDKGMHNPYWKNLAYFNKKYNTNIGDFFEVYMSNILRENTHERLI